MGFFDNIRTTVAGATSLTSAASLAQVPQATTAPTTTPVATTCSRAVNTTSGPMAGGISYCYPDVLDELDVVTLDASSGEPLYRSGTIIGHSYDFVMFDSKRVIKEVAIYLKLMLDAASEENVDLKVDSGFRTMAHQQRLYEVYQAGGNLAAPAGSSNHQNGIAVDLNVHAAGGRYEWLVKNAWKFGFIRTSPRERWHWEYWGDWAGQEKPEWAKSTLWGSAGHTPKTMFSRVPRIHTCGNSATGGGTGVIRQKNWLNNRQPSLCPNHSDGTTSGRNNSWVGFGNELLPDKFDREDDGWDRA